MAKLKMEMYNKDQKNQYLIFEENKHTKERVLSYFKRLSKYEDEYGKDISEMSTDELINIMSSLNIRRDNSRVQMLSLVRGYIDWAKQRGFVQSNKAIHEIGSDMIGTPHSITSEMLKDPSQLQDVLDKTYDATNQPNRYTRDSLILWLLYSGINAKVIVELKKKDINFKKNLIIDINGDMYNVDDKIKNLWKTCAEMTYIEKNSSNQSKTKKTKNANEFVENRLVESDFLFRILDDNRKRKCIGFSINSLGAIVSRAFENYSEAIGYHIQVSPDRINNSGIFYRMYEAEKKHGKKITLEEIADRFRLNNLNNVNNRAKARKIETDYMDWKIAFGYN